MCHTVYDGYSYLYKIEVSPSLRTQKEAINRSKHG